MIRRIPRGRIIKDLCVWAFYYDNEPPFAGVVLSLFSEDVFICPEGSGGNMIPWSGEYIMYNRLFTRDPNDSQKTDYPGNTYYEALANLV